jgi:hypothetical protein
VPASRRRLAVAAGVLVAAVAAGVALLVLTPRGRGRPESSPRSAAYSFHSAPALRPPKVTVMASAPDAAPGLLFLAPKRLAPQAGPMIADAAGQLVWFRRVPKGQAASSFRVQTYRGRPVLTWWQGHTDATGHGHGIYVIADTHYRIIATVRAGNGLEGDLHEFRLTPRGTALLTIYHTVTGDLRPAHGPRRGAGHRLHRPGGRRGDRQGAL